MNINDGLNEAGKHYLKEAEETLIMQQEEGKPVLPDVGDYAEITIRGKVVKKEIVRDYAKGKDIEVMTIQNVHEYVSAPTEAFELLTDDEYKAKKEVF